MISEDEMMEAGDYWVTKFTKRSAVLANLKTRLIKFGDGLTENVYAMVEKSNTHGVPNVKIENMPDRHSDYVMVHKRWIANVVTPVEAAIIQVFRRVVSQDLISYKEYEDEVYYVFEPSLRKSLRKAKSDGVTKHDELERFTPGAIQNGFRQLEHRFILGQRAIMMPPEVRVAIYSGEMSDEFKQPAVDGARWKKPRKITVPLMVHEKLLKENLSKETETAIEKFFRDMLVISGTYKGRKIFTGMDPANPGKNVLENMIRVKETDRVRMRVVNPHRRTKAEKNIIYGDDGSSDEEEEEDKNLIFPPSEDRIVFNESSRIEERVAEMAHRRVPLDPDVLAVFKTAYEKYR